ncbi:interleukin-7 receptor subunit alpha-like isoform X1 [Mobula hypostoma]|uniref:interleukin-7 receptor subunit alpha-like isoform X1 n=2 Tax=Mobula hypostoma TaxID=723540 RepID=UPI002FC3141B
MDAHVLLPFLLLPVSLLLAESGSDDTDDEPDPPQLLCFVTFQERGQAEWMNCRLSEPPDPGENLTLIVSEKNIMERCLILGPALSCRVPIKRFSLINTCCIHALRPGSHSHGPCHLKQRITHMVKPDAPFNLSVTALREAEEMEVRWDVPRVRFTQLFNNLLHQLVYWSTELDRQDLNVTVCSLRLLMRNLVASSQYTVQIRSCPNQKYFKGEWSEWSKPVTFTVPSINQLNSTGVKVTLSMLLLLLLFLVGLLVLLWENRIKPYIWPQIPNPKKAQKQLYTSSNKAAEVSFDPGHFLEVTENRVDMMAVKGVWPWHCYPYPDLPTETAGDGSPDPERKLLMQTAVESVDGPDSTSDQGQQDTTGPQDEWAQPSEPTSCFLPFPVTQDPSPCVPDHRRPAEAQAGGLNCPLTQVPAPPSDESYITMSNLYKTQ